MVCRVMLANGRPVERQAHFVEPEDCVEMMRAVHVPDTPWAVNPAKATASAFA